MATFEDAVVKTKEYFDLACQKTGEFVDVQKLKYEAAKIRSAVKKDYETIGRMYYDKIKKGKDNADVIKVVVADIDDKKAIIAEIEDKIREAKGGNCCNNCGTQNSDDSDFCRKCGKKL